MAGFAPKTEVKLDPPKEDPIDLEELAKCDGTHDGKPIYVAIKGGCSLACLLLLVLVLYSDSDADRQLLFNSLSPRCLLLLQCHILTIAGTVFDVSNKKDMYGPGAGYHVRTLQELPL